MNKEARVRGKQGVVMHPCPLTRNGLLHFFNTHLPDFTFQTAGSFSDMGCLSSLTKADLVVSDISDDERDPTYGSDWLVWLQDIRSDKPLVVITEELPEQQLIGLFRQPFLSVLTLQTPEHLLLQQLQQVLAGKQVFSPRLASLSAPAAPLAELTVAELQVFELLHAGYSVTQIASQLFRSAKTVSTHKRHLMSKLRVNNEIELFARVKKLNEKTYCLDNGQQFVKHPHPGAL